MNQCNELNKFGGNVVESGNNQAGSNANQGVSDFGEAAAGTLQKCICVNLTKKDRHKRQSFFY